MINIKVVSEPDFKKIEKNISKTFKSGVLKLIKSGATYMKGIVPVKKGDLRNSINWNEDGIWSTSKYFKYVDEGTRPHIITGNPFLAFQINGATIITRSVKHPGTKPQNITKKTEEYLKKHVSDIERDIKRVI